MLVPVLLAVFWKRGINRLTSIGVVLAFAGLYLLTVPASSGAGLNLRSMNHGDLLTLGAAVVFAFHIILIEHATQNHSWQQITVVQVAVTALLMIFTHVFCGEDFRGVDSAGAVGNWHYRVSQPGAGLRHPGVGAAVHARYSYGADLHSGASICLADVVHFSGRTSGRTLRRGRRLHSGRTSDFRREGQRRIDGRFSGPCGGAGAAWVDLPNNPARPAAGSAKPTWAPVHGVRLSLRSILGGANMQISTTAPEFGSIPLARNIDLQ